MASHAQRAADAGLITWDTLRAGLIAAARLRGEWAGIPMPLGHVPLVIEPKYPKAKELSQIYDKQIQTTTEKDKAHAAEFSHFRNTFWSWRWRSDIHIWQTKEGRIKWGLTPKAHSAMMQLDTLGCVPAWSLETEQVAMDTLRSLVTEHAFKCYSLTGQFLETSPRSKVTYLFRRLRPTIAFRVYEDKPETENIKILASLCGHPIAYYENTWAGAMCPTDDVIAALMLMRGDERLLWSRYNQHAAWRPEAGI